MEKTLVAITGASSGIGAAFAQRLAPQHDLLLIARRRDKLEALAADLKQRFGCQAEILTADLTQESDTDTVADRLTSDPRLVLLVNNAGFGTKGRFWEVPLDGQRNMHQLHVMATMRLTHAALRNLTKQKSGAIINVASVAAFIRGQGSVSYCATKSWMTAFTEGLALELKAAGSPVRVQALCPGFTYSEFHETMGADRGALATGPFWHSAEFVVDASLEGLHRNKLFVIPGWRYRVLTSIITKLPTLLRLQLEGRVGRRRTQQIQQAQETARPLE